MRRRATPMALLALSAGIATASAGRISPGLDPATASTGPYAHAAGVLTRYRVWGTKGRPIVLLHGFVESTDVWTRVAPLLARDHRVIAIDLRGFGYSERRGPYSAASMADQVTALLQQLHVTQPLLVGHSMGAGVLAELARRDPRAIRGMIFADGDGLADGSGGPLGSVASGPVAGIALALALSSDALMRSILRGAYGPSHPRLTRALIERWRRPLRVRGTAGALAAMTKQGGIGLTRDELPSARHVPSALIWGQFDSLPIETGRFAARALGGSPIWTIAGAGHLTPLTHPARFAELVERFERQLDARS